MDERQKKPEGPQEFGVHETAEETLKKHIIKKLITAEEYYNQLQSYMMLKKRNRQAQIVFKSEVMSLYMFLRSKIKKLYIAKNKSEQADIEEKIKEYDQLILNPSKASILDTINMFSFLNNFIESYLPLTPTKYWGRRSNE